MGEGWVWWTEIEIGIFGWGEVGQSFIIESFFIGVNLKSFPIFVFSLIFIEEEFQSIFVGVVNDFNIINVSSFSSISNLDEL